MGYITGLLSAEQISAISSIVILLYIAINIKKIRIDEVLLILATILFVGGAVGYITGLLSAEQIPGIGALALIFIGAGAGMKMK